MPIASAPECRTCAFSSSSTSAPCSAAVSAAMVPAVPPPITTTPQLSSAASVSSGMSTERALREVRGSTAQCVKEVAAYGGGGGGAVGGAVAGVRHGEEPHRLAVRRAQQGD